MKTHILQNIDRDSNQNASNMAWGNAIRNPFAIVMEMPQGQQIVRVRMVKFDMKENSVKE